jgi:hypothetical protein
MDWKGAMRYFLSDNLGPIIGASFAVFAVWWILWAYTPVAWIYMTESNVTSPQNATKLDLAIVTAKVSGYKLRDCKLLQHTEKGWLWQDGAWRDVHFKFNIREPLKPGFSRPQQFSKQNFGQWTWLVPKAYAKASFYVQTTVQHLCEGDEVPRTTIVGPFLITPPMKL